MDEVDYKELLETAQEIHNEEKQMFEAMKVTEDILIQFATYLKIAEAYINQHSQIKEVCNMEILREDMEKLLHKAVKYSPALGTALGYDTL